MLGRRTWSLTLKEDDRLRMFKNRVLRRIFGRKRDEATGEWRKLHNEELRDLCSSPCIIRIIKLRGLGWVDHVARMGQNAGKLSSAPPTTRHYITNPHPYLCSTSIYISSLHSDHSPYTDVKFTMLQVRIPIHINFCITLTFIFITFNIFIMI
jgi:hypothetical protein